MRAQIKKVLPSMMRTIFGSDKIVEFEPVGPDDEKSADQATDYINFVLMRESDGYRAIESAIHDALLQRNGILKWWFEEKRTATATDFSGLQDEEFAVLVSADGVEVIEPFRAGRDDRGGAGDGA